VSIASIPFSIKSTLQVFRIFMLSLCMGGISTVHSGCDFLRTGEFSIDSWLPGAGYQEFTAGSTLSLTFSLPPDTISVEEAITVTADGVELVGQYEWQGSTVEFIPAYPPLVPCDYIIRVARSAQALDGLSLDDDLEFRFTTRTSHTRPELTSCSPGHGSAVSGLRAPLVLSFNEAIDSLSLRKAFSLTPTVSGAWQFNGDNTTATFTPFQDWVRTQTYSLKISTALKTLQNMALVENIESEFLGGTDLAAPQLISLVAINASDTVVLSLLPEDPLMATQVLNVGWEDSWSLQIQFDEPVNCATLDSRLVTEGGPALERVGSNRFAATVVYRLIEKPDWDSVFLCTLKPGIEDQSANKSEAQVQYRIWANGTASRPPEVLAVRMPLLPGEADIAAQLWTLWTVADSWGQFDIEDVPLGYRINTNTATCFEVYIRLAENTELNLYSVMESFRVEATGGAVSFSPKLIKTNTAEFLNPTPDASVSLPYIRIEIHGTLRNSTEAGIVRLIFATSLRDKADRHLAQQWQLPLIK